MVVSDGEIAWRELEKCMQEWNNIDKLYVKCGDTVVGAYRQKEIDGRKVEYYTERKPSLRERLREHWTDVVVGIIGLTLLLIVGYLVSQEFYS